MKTKLIKKCLKGYPLRDLTELEKNQLVQTGYAPAVGSLVRTGVKVLPEIGKLVATLPFVAQTAEQLQSFELPQFSTSAISNYLRKGIPTSSSAPSKKSYPRVTSPADNREIEKEISREIVESWPYRQNIMVLDPLGRLYTTGGYEIPEGYIYPKGTIYETLPTIHLDPVELIAPRVVKFSEQVDALPTTEQPANNPTSLKNELRKNKLPKDSLKNDKKWWSWKSYIAGAATWPVLKSLWDLHQKINELEQQLQLQKQQNDSILKVNNDTKNQELQDSLNRAKQIEALKSLLNLK